MSNNITIEVVAVTVQTVPTARGSYAFVDLAYKNKSFNDKLEGKKIMDFTNKAVFNTLADAKMGDVFDVSREKNDKGYWEWKEVTKSSGANVVSTGETPVQVSKPAAVSPKSNYETSEERAARQIMIVRQSSISSAVAALKVEKAALKVDEVINFARHLEAYVLENRGGDNPFANVPDELPFNES